MNETYLGRETTAKYCPNWSRYERNSSGEPKVLGRVGRAMLSTSEDVTG